MTIDEQIKILESNAEFERKNGDLNGCLNFRQLADWLKDYKRLLEQQNDAIKYFDTIYKVSQTYGIPYSFVEDKVKKAATALKTLQQESCDDTISRQAAKKALEDRFMELQKRHSADRYETNFCLNTILELPPVTSQPKMGHWTMHRGYNADGFGIEYSCSECNDWNDEKSIYCPNCGAKMSEVQESEDKE